MDEVEQSAKLVSRRSSAELWWKVPAGAMLLALAFIGALYFASTHLGLGKLRADLKARGFKLSLRELRPSDQRVSTNLQQFIELDQSLQQVTGFEAGNRVRLMEISPTPLPTIQRGRPFEDPGYKSLTNLTWEDLTEIMRRAAPSCERLRTLARQRISENELWSDVSVFGFINDASWLANDAVCALREGSRERALEDLESFTDLALVRSGEKQHITQIAVSAIVRIGLMTSWEVLQSAEWTEPELKRMEAAWKRIWPLQAAERAAEGEVAMAGEMWPEVRKEAGTAPWQDRWANIIGQDMAGDAQFLLEYPLAHFDAARALERGADWKALRPGLQKLKADAYRRTHSRYRHFALRVLLSKFDSTFDNSAQNEAAKQLLLADIAIRKFELKHSGALPKTLRELRPEFLEPTFGRDVFGAGDLKYKVNPDGTYLLYSVGLDGVDDGGAVAPTGESHAFWDSADMVWPRCR